MAEGTVALAGNPNTGKSTLFNAVTGARQHVGNWPGKTVSRRTGTWRHEGREYLVVDLPGTYSLSAYSVEETIARDYLLDARPEVVTVVVDASNLERNLYLAAQILEMRGNVVVALNMADTAAARGVEIDTATLSRRLNAPVVLTTARKGRGLDALQAAIVAMMNGSAIAPADREVVA